MAVAQVGVQEFRANLSEYLEAKGPVQITKDGRPVGVFLPTPEDRAAKRKRFYETRAKIDALLSESEREAILEEFINSRKNGRRG